MKKKKKNAHHSSRNLCPKARKLCQAPWLIQSGCICMLHKCLLRKSTLQRLYVLFSVPVFTNAPEWTNPQSPGPNCIKLYNIKLSRLVSCSKDHFSLSYLHFATDVYSKRHHISALNAFQNTTSRYNLCKPVKDVQLKLIKILGH